MGAYRPTRGIDIIMFDIAQWQGFFGALAGAAAALVGLVFVSLSINLTRVLAVKGLSARAAEAIALLSSVLLVALLGLVPGQPSGIFGLELLGVGLLSWGFQTAVQIRALRRREYAGGGQFALRVALAQAATLPLLLAGGVCCCGTVRAFTGSFPGVILSLVAGLLNAWVFLVEIER